MMKKLMQLLLLCLATVPATAQTEKSNVLIYKLDGKVDTLLLNNVLDIYHSRRDVNGVEQPDISTLRLRTIGGERVYPLTEIDHVVMPKGRRVVSFMGTSENFQGGNARGPRKTAITGDFPDGQTYLYQWVSGDYIYLSSGDRSRNVEYPYSSLSDHDRYRSERGHFEFVSDSLVADQYIVLYSGTNRGTNDNPIPFNKVMIPTTQTQSAPDNSDHLGASGDCGVAPAVRQKNSNYNFELAHKTAILCFMPRVEAYEGKLLETLRLKHVAVKADKDIAGTFTLSPEGLSSEPDASTGSDTITLLTNNFNISLPHQKATAQDSVASYMVVAPQTGKTTFKVYYRLYDVQSEIDTVVEKTIRKKYPLTMDSIKTNITDIAGVRIITYYKDDVYHVRDEIVRSSGLKVLEEIDYIKNPKPNGYRSLHLVLEVPISIPNKEGTAVEGEKTAEDEETPAIIVPVEVQIRSMFEEVWGEGDHLTNYKKDTPSKEAIAVFKHMGDLLDQLDDDLIRLRDNLPLKTKREPEEPST